ncbi:MAG: IS1182 family transposase [Clostridia bacterium]|nr:IS1182 family transposase [Clostridia bacterium]
MRRNQLFLPLNLEKIIEPSESVRTLDEICEQLDYSELNKTYLRERRIESATPEAMFKILVYGYMTGNYSSRKIEEACKNNINFMWLLDGAKAPDHNTIARFRTRRLQKIIEDLFAQLVAKLSSLGEIELKNLFVDGTKIEANANRYSFVWKKTVEKNGAKLEEKINISLEELNIKYKRSFSNIYEAQKYLLNQKEKFNIEFVNGKGKHKLPLQRDFEMVEDCIEKAEKYSEYNNIFAGRNSFSKTDKDATFMHMKEDHMRNGQLKAGYNVQIGVDSEYIVNMGIFSERSDQLTLIPFLEDTKAKVGKYKEVVADAGYESEENYVYLNEQQQDSYIKPSNYEASKKKIKNKYSTQNFIYNAETNTYLCPGNQELRPIEIKKCKSKSGYISEKTIYGCNECENCPHRTLCTQAQNGRRIQRATVFTNFRNESLKNITTEKGILLRMNRSIQVEGAFGVLKQDYGFRRFLTRGNENVKIEMLLLCFAFNINKLHNKTLKKRRKTHLFEKMIA